jgi:RNA polymerase sigma-70 factor, ECF subfamily
VTDYSASRTTANRRTTREVEWRSYVTQCASGDHSALAELYDESSSLVYSVALRILGDAADAEEVTMDVYTQIWKRAAAYEESRGTVTTWLVTLARSRAIDRARSRSGRLQKEIAIPESFDLPAGEASPERHTEETQRRRHVLAALETLPPDQREVVRLAFYGGLTHSELAARLEQPLGTVKTRLRTGMMKLREQLTPLSA